MSFSWYTSRKSLVVYNSIIVLEKKNYILCSFCPWYSPHVWSIEQLGPQKTFRNHILLCRSITSVYIAPGKWKLFIYMSVGVWYLKTIFQTLVWATVCFPLEKKIRNYIQEWSSKIDSILRNEIHKTVFSSLYTTLSDLNLKSINSFI